MLNFLSSLCYLRTNAGLRFSEADAKEGLKIAYFNCTKGEFYSWHAKYYYLYAFIIFQRDILLVGSASALLNSNLLITQEEDELLLRQTLSLSKSREEEIVIGAINVLNVGLKYYCNSQVSSTQYV